MEIEIKMKSNKKGLKYDTGKPRIDLIPAHTIISLGKCLEYGARKYSPNTWQNIHNPLGVHYAAAMRHLLAWKEGEKIDNESGLLHLEHAFSNIMFLLDHEKEKRK